MTDLERLNKIVPSNPLEDYLRGLLISDIKEDNLENADKDKDDDLLSLIENNYGGNKEIYNPLMEFLNKHNLFPL